MSKDGSINWMYEGAKSNVHREDYLLGKKVDKNFEKYSDVVNTQKAETIDAIVGTRTVYGVGESSSGFKTSSLQKDIIKSEDPFVAVKVREETKRRELMDNPLMKARLQTMLKTMMTSKSEKKKEKKSKKDKKKKKKRSRSSSASSRDSSEERSVRRRRSPSPKRKIRRDSSGDRSRKHSSPKRHRSESRDRKSFRRHEVKDRRSPRREIREHRKRSKSPETSRKYDSHIPEHLQKRRRSSPSQSESEDDRRGRRRSDDEAEDPRKKSYGLVEMRKRTAEEREEEARAPSKELKLVKLPTGRGGNERRNEPRKKLTEEEKAARLAEMQENVKWRNEVRTSNVERNKAEDKEEKETADKNGYAPSFIRSQMRDACDDMTVEKRLQSRKGGVQRSHGYMDKSFARK